MQNKRRAQPLPEKRPVKSLGKAFDILEYVSQPEEGATTSDVASALSLPKATASRLLAALAERRYLERDPATRRFRPGLKLLEIGSRLLNRLPLNIYARPLMRELTRETGLDSRLAVFDAGQAIYTDAYQNPDSPYSGTPIGRRFFCHASASGKVLIASLPENEIRAYMKKPGMPKLGPKTITSIDILLEQLDKISRQGWAIDNEEYAAGFRCLAAPVKDHMGRVIAAISTGGAVSLLDSTRLPSLRGALLKTAAELSRRMGFSGIDSP